MLSNEPKNLPIRPFAPKSPILALASLPLYPYTDALLKKTNYLALSYEYTRQLPIHKKLQPRRHHSELLFSLHTICDREKLKVTSHNSRGKHRTWYM
jgi:hypothetical protein